VRNRYCKILVTLAPAQAHMMWKEQAGGGQRDCFKVSKSLFCSPGSGLGSQAVQKVYRPSDLQALRAMVCRSMR
jgi:hypothetical protein